jgi:hypothetical protein
MDRASRRLDTIPAPISRNLANLRRREVKACAEADCECLSSIAGSASEGSRNRGRCPLYRLGEKLDLGYRGPNVIPCRSAFSKPHGS